MSTLYRDEQSRPVVIGDGFRGDERWRETPDSSVFVTVGVGTSVTVTSCRQWNPRASRRANRYRESKAA